MDIQLHQPAIGDCEIQRVTSVLKAGAIKGGGEFDEKCSRFLENRFETPRALMTTSCTHALEMAALLLNVGPGDKVIVPSYTFSSTATAFAVHGAEIRFCEIDGKSLTMNPEALRTCITSDTVAVVPVHYAGVACKMDEITEIAATHGAAVVEDAAQALNACYKGEPLGTIGDIGCFSFHGTKSYVAGEGGAIFLNDDSYVERAEYLRQKGTNFEKFKRHKIDRYQWVDIGSSYVPSELQTALAYSQLERMDAIKDAQRRVHEWYNDAFRDLESEGHVQLPTIPECCDPNYHLYYLVTAGGAERNELVDTLREAGIGAASHYEPLHTSPYGRQYGCKKGDLPVTESVSRGLLRLPIHTGLNQSDVDTIVEVVRAFFE